MSESESTPVNGLIIIARDGTGQVITRLPCTRSHTVLSVMKHAYSVLMLKEGAVRVEVHRREAPTSAYTGHPLASMSSDDLVREPVR